MKNQKQGGRTFYITCFYTPYLKMMM